MNQESGTATPHPARSAGRTAALALCAVCILVAIASAGYAAVQAHSRSTQLEQQLADQSKSLGELRAQLDAEGKRSAELQRRNGELEQQLAGYKAQWTNESGKFTSALEAFAKQAGACEVLRRRVTAPEAQKRS